MRAWLLLVVAGCGGVAHEVDELDPEPLPAPPCVQHEDCFTEDTCIAQEWCEPDHELAGDDGCRRVYRVRGEQCEAGACEYVAGDGHPGDPVECRP